MCGRVPHPSVVGWVGKPTASGGPPIDERRIGDATCYDNKTDDVCKTGLPVKLTCQAPVV